MQKGIATFTLDYGKCPRWLFERMVKLGREMTRVMIDDFGPDEYVHRLADPVWFQSLGTVLAFDWNASGLTTILTAALKEAIKGQEKELGIFICGGKGKTSRKTPDEILSWGQELSLTEGNANKLVYNSKMSAKVDSSLVQDGFQIYHHSFIFSSPPSANWRSGGAWAVIQQGMNTKNQTARRYHWFSEDVNDLVREPHTGIVSDLKLASTLNLASKNSDKNRDISTQLVSASKKELDKDIQILQKHTSKLSQMVSFKHNQEKITLLQLADTEFKYHPVVEENFFDSPYLNKILTKLCDYKPKSYEKLLATERVGPKTVRALSLVAEIIYGAKPSYQDPARYSFAHGGKDHTPYPIDRPTYDQTIEYLSQVVLKSRLNPIEKDKAFKRLNSHQRPSLSS